MYQIQSQYMAKSANMTNGPLSGLRELYLADNRLEDSIFGPLSHIPSLVALNISFNDLSDIGGGLKNAINLIELNLSGNQLTTLPDDIGSIRGLKCLYVNGNKLTSLPAELGKIPGLCVLDASSNNLKYNITNWPYDWNWNWNLELQYLNLSDNKRLEIKSNTSPFADAELAHSEKLQAIAAGNANSNQKDAAAAAAAAAAGNAQQFGTSTLGAGFPGMGPSGRKNLAEFGALTKLKVLGLMDVSLMVPLPAETSDRRVRIMTSSLEGGYISYGIADALPRSSAGEELAVWDLILPKYMRLFHNTALGSEHNTSATTLPLPAMPAVPQPSTASTQVQNTSGSSLPGVTYGSLKNDGGSGFGAANIGSTILEDANSHINLNIDSSFNNLSSGPPILIQATSADIAGTSAPTTTNPLAPSKATRRASMSAQKTQPLVVPVAPASQSLDRRMSDGHRECLFGIFDGRNSGRIAKYVSDWFAAHLSAELKALSKKHARDREKEKDDGNVAVTDDGRHMEDQPSNVASAIRRAYLSLEKSLVAKNPDLLLNRYIGSSGLVAYIMDTTLYVSNVGDSIAVLCRNGSAIALSTKHSPWNKDEMARVRRLGGFISHEGKIDGEIELSRNFGHIPLLPIIKPDPTITVTELTDGDEFVIMGNRALWDTMSYQTAVDVARMERGEWMLAAQKLRDFAISHSRGHNKKEFKEVADPIAAGAGIMVIVLGVRDLFQAPGGHRVGEGAGGGDGGQQKSERKRRPKDEITDSTLARLEKEVAPPIGRVAIVFTDIKNSTKLWETIPTAMRAGIKIHNSIMRRSLRLMGGYEVKTEGDAFMVCFSNVIDAMRWSMVVQLQLLEADWPQEIVQSADGREICISSAQSTSVFNTSTNAPADGSASSASSAPALPTTDRSGALGQAANNFEDQFALEAMGLGESGSASGHFMTSPRYLYRGLSVRMGIHYGAPVCEADPITGRMDYFGPMVNRSGAGLLRCRWGSHFCFDGCPGFVQCNIAVRRSHVAGVGDDKDV